MELSQALGILAGVIYLSAYIPYFWAIIREGKRPSIVTWGIWSVLCLLNVFTYLKLARGDVWMSVIPLSNIFLCLATFVVVYLVSDNKDVRFVDAMAVFIGVTAAIIWLFYKSAANANLLLQVAILTGFIPTWRLVWKDYSKEKPGVWWVWSLSYSIGLIVAAMRGRGWIENVYYANCAILHASVPILITYSRINNDPRKLFDKLKDVTISIAAMECRQASCYEPSRRSTLWDDDSPKLEDLYKEERVLRRRLGIPDGESI